MLHLEEQGRHKAWSHPPHPLSALEVDTSNIKNEQIPRYLTNAVFDPGTSTSTLYECGGASITHIIHLSGEIFCLFVIVWRLIMGSWRRSNFGFSKNHFTVQKKLKKIFCLWTCIRGQDNKIGHGQEQNLQILGDMVPIVCYLRFQKSSEMEIIKGETDQLTPWLMEFFFYNPDHQHLCLKFSVL